MYWPCSSPYILSKLIRLGDGLRCKHSTQESRMILDESPSQPRLFDALLPWGPDQRFRLRLGPQSVAWIDMNRHQYRYKPKVIVHILGRRGLCGMSIMSYSEKHEKNVHSILHNMCFVSWTTYDEICMHHALYVRCVYASIIALHSKHNYMYNHIDNEKDG